MGAEREWWRRAAEVIARPRATFEALRDSSEDTANDRQEVVVALAFAGGVAAALATAGEALEDLGALDTVVAVFAAAFAYAFLGYWVLGWGLSFVVPRLGGAGPRRRTRHVLAFALAPLAFAAGVWWITPWLLVPLAVWSLGLLLFGLTVVYGWSYTRAPIAVGLALVWLAALAVGLWSLLALLRR